MSDLDNFSPILTETGTKDILSDEYEATYLRAATSDNTREAYQRDVNHFLGQGGQLPATPELIEAYLKQCAPDYNPRTLKRRLIALRQWHQLKGEKDPTKHPMVTKTMRGIARLHGVPRKQAHAMRLADLDQIVKYLNLQDKPLTIRNRALLLLGFFGAFRRSELIALQWENVRFEENGMIITVSRSKTDQTGEGMDCVIPFGNDVRCPVRALISWRSTSRQFTGPIFRRISKTGNIGAQAITPQYFNRLLRQIAKEAGIAQADKMSSHSLRRGFATEASRLGASMPAIQRHGRWRSTKTVFEYIEAGRQFTDSAVNVLFEF